MIYQYYYSKDCDDTLPNERSSYNIYFNISGGKLEFPEPWTDISSGVPDLTGVPWSSLTDGTLASIYADIFKQDDLRFYYNHESSNYFYKEWKNFKIIDSSASVDYGNWAAYPNTRDTNKYNNAVKSVLGALNSIRDLSLSESFGIYYEGTEETQVYKKIASLSNEDKHKIHYLWYNDPSISVTDTTPHNDHANNLTNLKQINLTNKVSTIGSLTFASSPHLKTLTIPASVTDISDHAFKDASGLTTLTFLGPKPSNFLTLHFSGTNLQTIYYIEGQSGWSPSTLITSSLTYITTPLPYNENIFGNPRVYENQLAIGRIFDLSFPGGDTSYNIGDLSFGSVTIEIWATTSGSNGFIFEASANDYNFTFKRVNNKLELTKTDSTYPDYGNIVTNKAGPQQSVLTINPHDLSYLPVQLYYNGINITWALDLPGWPPITLAGNNGTIPFDRYNCKLLSFSAQYYSIRMWNRVLTPLEIQALYYQGNPEGS